LGVFQGEISLSVQSHFSNSGGMRRLSDSVSIRLFAHEAV
jgi:hypothetical protein